MDSGYSSLVRHKITGICLRAIDMFGHNSFRSTFGMSFLSFLSTTVEACCEDACAFDGGHVLKKIKEEVICND